MFNSPGLAVLSFTYESFWLISVVQLATCRSGNDVNRNSITRNLSLSLFRTHREKGWYFPHAPPSTALQTPKKITYMCHVLATGTERQYFFFVLGWIIFSLDENQYSRVVT